MFFNSNRSLSEKLFLYLYSVFCLLSCLYQIYKICDIYFAYKTSTFVTYDDISTISLPAITVCMDKTEVLKRNAFDTNGDQVSSNELLANLSIREQFERLYDFTDIFNNCSVIGTIDLKSETHNPLIKCETVSSIKKSIDSTRFEIMYS